MGKNQELVKNTTIEELKIIEQELIIKRKRNELISINFYIFMRNSI